jgi:SSS family transporter
MPRGSHRSTENVTGQSARIERFFLADRTVGWLAGSASLAATQMSAGTLVGTVGIHYAFGISFLAIWPGIWLGWLCSMWFVAPQLRRLGGVTVTEFVAVRFSADGADGRHVRALVATLIASIYLVYTAAQYIAGAVVLETILGVPRLWGMVGLAVLVLGYTALGGMRASVLSDAIQMGLILLGLFVAVAVGLSHVGGLDDLSRRATAVDPALLGWGMAPVDVVGFALAFGLGIVVAPYEMSRVHAMESPETVVTAIKGAVCIQAVVGACVALLGLIARVVFPSLASPDAAIATFATSLLGPVGSGLFLLAVLAAVLSTLDSVLLVSASAVAYDLYDGVFRPVDALTARGLDDVLFVSRATTVGVALLPLGLAIHPALLGGLVQLVVALYAALVAGTLLAPVVLGLHWDGATTTGALAGVLFGFAAVVTWHVLTDLAASVPPPLSAAPPVLVGVTVSTTAVVVGSALSRSLTPFAVRET